MLKFSPQRDVPLRARAGVLRSLPPRFMVPVVCFIALVIAYCDRVNVAAAAPQIMVQRQWNTEQMSWVLSGFFLGYAVFLIPSGMLVQRIGARPVLYLSIAGWSLFTILTPLPRTLAGMYTVRLLLGISESALFPSVNSLLAAWIPRRDYAKAAGFCWSGGYAGPILAFPVAEIMLSLWGWRSIFQIFGAAGLVWLWVCWKALSSSPESADCQIPATAASFSGIITCFRLLREKAVWAIFLLHFSSNWFVYLLLTWLPTYLTDVRHFSRSLVATGSALPFLVALIAANGFAFAIARLSIGRDATRVRKSILLVYALAACIFMLLPWLQSASSVIAALVTSTAMMTAATPVYAAGSLELAPKAAGMLAGLQQAFANIAGVVAPLVTGYLARTSWAQVFYVAGAVCLMGAVAYVVLGSAKTIALHEIASGNAV